MEKIIETFKNIFRPFVHWLESTFPFINAGQGKWWFLGLAILLLLLIILIIVLIVKAVKKNKANKAAISSSTTHRESKSAEELVKDAVMEDKPVVEEKVEEEPAPVEEEAMEEAPVEEEPVVEEEVEEPVKEEPVVEEEPKVEEEAKEETPVEEPKEEPAPVEEVKEEEPAPAPVVKEEPKKAPAKKAPAKKAPAKKEEPKKAPVTKEEPKAEDASKASLKDGKFILVPEGENWRYKLLASNGQIIIVSEPYTSEKSVRTGIETLKKNLNNSKIDFIKDKHNLYYFMILTKQGRCLATSASYKTKASATSASESYKRWAVTDVIEIDTNASSEHTEVEKIEVEVEEDNTGTFIVRPEGDGFVYQLIAANKVVVATSQIYKSKESAISASETFRECVYKGDFLVSKDKNDCYQFKLYNKQKRLVLAGEVYQDRSRVISVIEAIKRLAKKAELKEVAEGE